MMVSFIGSGNMAQALITGLLHHGTPPSQILACSPDTAQLQDLSNRLQIQTNTDNQAACQADILILAIKPGQMKAVIEALKPTAKTMPLILSVAAGIRTDQMQGWFQMPVHIIRVMPNTPVLKQMGAMGLYAAETVPGPQKQLAEKICQMVGITEWIPEESLMDVVTALSGSGPAYFFYWVESLIEGAVQLGLPEPIAKNLSYQTILGAAQMLQEEPESAKTLRQRVTSPNGTTEKGLTVLEQAHTKQIIYNVLEAATARGRAMAQEWDDKQ